MFTMLRNRASDNRDLATWLVMATYAEKLDDYDTAMEGPLKRLRHRRRNELDTVLPNSGS